MARVVFDSFEPNNACFESPAAKASSKKTDDCEVKAIFHAEGAVGYDPQQPPTAYFRRRGSEFYLDPSPSFSVSVALLRGLGFQENDSTIQSKILYAIGLSDGLNGLYNHFIKSKKHPVTPFVDLITKYKNFLITGILDSADPISVRLNSDLVKSILNASPDALEFIEKMSKSFSDPNGNQSRFLPEMQPKITWLSAVIRINIELSGVIAAYNEYSPELFKQTDQWVKQIITYIASGTGDPQIILDELVKLCDTAREQGNIPPEYKNLAFLIKDKLAPFYDIGNILQSANVKRRWNQVMTQIMLEETRYHLTVAAEIGSIQNEVEKESRQAKLSKRWLEDKARVHEIMNAIFSAGKIFISPSKKSLLSLDATNIESAVKKMLAAHGIQEREYIIGTLAILRYAKSQTWIQVEANEDPAHKFKMNREGFQSLEAYEQKLLRKLSSSISKTNIVLPLVEAGICLVGGVLAGTGAGIQNRNLTLTGSSITGFGCSALAFHFIPSRNDYIKDPLVGLLGAATAFTAAWFATQNMGNPMMPPPNMMMPPLDPNSRNPVNGWGP